MVAVVLLHMQGCKARAVVVVPDDRQSWLPLLAAATVRSVAGAAKGGGQAIGHLLRLTCTILLGVQSLLSRPCAGQLTPASAPTLVRVEVARGRALCPDCHGKNDDMFHFCQWCATPSTCNTISAEGARLLIDEAALGAQYTQFSISLGNKTFTVRREATTTLLGQFLTSRTTDGAVGMATAQPRDTVPFLCWLDSCSNKRRTVVHAMHYTQVGTAGLSSCSTQPGECAKRYAHDSVRTTTFRNWPWRTSAISASLPTGAMLSGSATRSQVIWSHNA